MNPEKTTLRIDGSLHSGSGTLLRHAMALASLPGEPLHMTRIRAKREKPGLRPQYLHAVRSCTSLSGGEVHGGEVGSMEIRFRLGNSLKSGDFQRDIGTAGSATMLAFPLIPLALFAPGASNFTLTRGLFQDFAPSPFHMQKDGWPVRKNSRPQGIPPPDGDDRRPNRSSEGD